MRVAYVSDRGVGVGVYKSYDIYYTLVFNTFVVLVFTFPRT